jgi:clan AA aspartic protease (TIGR02281 family)
VRNLTFKLFGVCLSLLLAGQLDAAEFYRWVDQNGIIHFTDNLHNIPEKQRHTASRIQARETPRPPEPPKPPSPSKTTVPILKYGNIVVVDVTLNQQASAKLVVDTGATFTMISNAVAQQLGIAIDPARTVPFNTANGVIQAPLTDLSSITVGGMEVKNLTAAVHDTLPNSPVAGLLGLNFLSHFKMDIDTQKGLLHLEKK